MREIDPYYPANRLRYVTKSRTLMRCPARHSVLCMAFSSVTLAITLVMGVVWISPGRGLVRSKDVAEVDTVPPPPAFAEDILRRCASDAARSLSLRRAYVTFVSNAVYVPGALALANSLRRSGSRDWPFVVVITDELPRDSLNVIQRALPTAQFVTVAPLRSRHNVSLVRPYLRSAFTKLQLFSLTQYDVLLYLDADTVVLRPIDDLFDTVTDGFHLLAASAGAPFINSGLMVLRPHRALFGALLRMLEEGSYVHPFADQALIGQLLRPRTRLLPCADHVINLLWNNIRGDFGCPASVDERVTLPQVRVLHWVSTPKPFARFSMRQLFLYSHIYQLYREHLRAARGTIG